MAYTVSRITKYIKDIIDEDVILSNLSIEGEISNFKAHSSGHLYFTLKDEFSAISCVMFSTHTQKVDIIPKNGIRVCINGYISVYEKSGDYQLYALSIKALGRGQLREEFERLKLRLEKEGMFDENYKKNIPLCPKAVAVIASPTGAAVRDVINVSNERNPNVKIVVVPTLVQGENAPEDIARAIRLANRKKIADTIILARGGGSFEDINAFNSEIVARAIFYSKIPIISAVGHETDFTIADFVADKRASTPSVGADMAVPSADEELKRLILQKRRLMSAFSARLYSLEVRHEKCKAVLKKLSAYVDMKEGQKQELLKELEKNMKLFFESKQNRFSLALEKFTAFSPMNTLKRGYCSVSKENEAVKSIEDVKKGDKVSIRFSDGIVCAEVLNKYGSEKNI